MTREDYLVGVEIKTPIPAMVCGVPKKDGRGGTWFKLMVGVQMRVTKATKNTKIRVVGCGLV